MGTDATYRMFLATFAVESEANLTKVEGAYLTAIFGGSFVAFRYG